MVQKRTNRFGNAIHNRLKDMNRTIRDLANAIDMHYEHVRKLVHGISGASEESLGKISKYIGLPVSQLQEMLTADRIENKFGGLPHIMVGQNPELAQLGPVWERLTPEQRDSFTMQMKVVAENNVRVPINMQTRRPKRRPA